MVTLKTIKRQINRNKKGIKAGMIIGFIAVLYMRFSGLTTQAIIPAGGLIEQIITIPALDMALLKLFITAIILGGLVGYIIQEKIIK